MDRDPKGYYALLGVHPDATAAELRDAHARRAGDLDSSDRMGLARLDAAYAVLADRDARSSYDGGAVAPPPPAAPAPTTRQDAPECAPPVTSALAAAFPTRRPQRGYGTFIAIGVPSAIVLLLVSIIALSPNRETAERAGPSQRAERAEPSGPVVFPGPPDRYLFADGPVTHEGRFVSVFVETVGGATRNVLIVDEVLVQGPAPYLVSRVRFDCRNRRVETLSATRHHLDGQEEVVQVNSAPVSPGLEATPMFVAYDTVCHNRPVSRTVFHGLVEVQRYAFNRTSDARNAPACRRNLMSGDILEGAEPTQANLRRLSFRNDTGTTLVVKVRSAQGALQYSFLLDPRSQANMAVPPGGRIQYAQGDFLGRNCTSLIRTARVIGIQTPTGRLPASVRLLDWESSEQGEPISAEAFYAP